MRLIDVERFAMRLLPANTVKSLQGLKAKLPLRVDLAAPVVQMYLNDARTRSYVGLHNFYSCLLADVETRARVQLRFYGPGGEPVLTHTLRLAHFAAEAVDVRALFESKRVTAQFGVVTVQITPQSPRRKIYRELGRVSAHFFVFFRDQHTGSVEQTHPLSTADPDNRPSAPFSSSQIISTHGLRQLIAFQYNPGPHAHTLEHALVDLRTGNRVAARTCSLAAMASAQSVFTVSEISPLPPQLGFVVDALPSPNSKPMLRRVFDAGQHSMSHA